MKRTILLLVAALTVPVLAQSDPAPVVPSILPGADPFVGSLSITLSAGANAEIRWDTGSVDVPLEPGEGNLYADGQVIVIGHTTILRTLAEYPGMGQPPATIDYHYIRDAEPVIDFVTPNPSQTFRLGLPIALTASVTDPDESKPYSVRYYRVTGSTWTELTSANLTVSPYSFTWTPDASFPVGAVALRAVAKDAYGAADTAALSITIAANKAPTVTLATNPPNTSSFLAPATFTLVASPADPDGDITKVDFYKGSALLGSDIDGSPWTWPVPNLAESTYAFKAVAHDNGLPIATGSSTTLSVNVVANNPPKVAITYPEKGKSYYAPFAAKVTAGATDTDGGMQKVEFYNGTTLEATDLAPPWEFSKTFQAGTYTLTAKAFDSLGVFATSEPIGFTVAANLKPTAKTAKDTGIVIMTTPAPSYALNGSGSTDPEGGPLKYKWSGPAGVSFSPSDTAANPTANFPAAAGNYALQLKVTDPGTPPLSDSVRTTISVWTKPVLTGNFTVPAAVNETFTYTITGTGFPAPRFDASNRPGWLAFNAASNTLSGKPLATGPVTVSLSATSDAGTDTKPLVINVGDSLYMPVITSQLLDTAKMNAAFSYTITSRANPLPNYSVSALPAGLAFAGAVISGTPTVSGNFSINLTATNSKGTVTKTLNLLIVQDPRITRDLPDSLPSIFEKASATFSVTATGFPAPGYQWQYSASSTGPFAAAPGSTNSATYTIASASTASTGWYRVRLGNNGLSPDVYSKACRLKVNPLPAPVRITQQPAPQNATVGNRVIFKAKASGDLGPLYYQWFRGYPVRTPLAPASKQDDSVLTLDSVKTASADVYSVRVTNNLKDTVNASNFAWSDTARLAVQLPKLPMPTANPPTGSIYGPTQVALSVVPAAAAIWYTLDNSEPGAAPPSTLYTGPITIEGTRILKAKAFLAGSYLPSDAMKAEYTYIPPNKSAKPVIRPPDSSFTGTLLVTIFAPDSGTVYYSTDSSDPLVARKVCPPEGFTISTTTLVKAIAQKGTLLPSDTAMKLFTLSKPVPKVATPQFTPDSGLFSGSVDVRITCATPNAVLRYTTDGKDPDTASAVVPAGNVLTLTRTVQLKVMGTLPNFLNSDIVARNFRLGPGAITAYPAKDTVFAGRIAVDLRPSTPNAIIRYTLDGNAPDGESAIWPSGGMSFDTTVVITAVPYLGEQPGLQQRFTYTLEKGPLAMPMPVFAGGSFTFPDTIEVRLHSTPGANIYFTTDGTDPAIIPANLYREPIVLMRTTTLQAVAVLDGFEMSKQLSTTFTLDPQTPEMNPPSGSYSLPIEVRLSSPSRAADIYYTQDGTDPVTGNRIKYEGKPIQIASVGELKAVAVAGNRSSEVATATYSAIRILDTVLAPGSTLFLDQGYTLRIPESENASVRVRTGNPSPSQMTGFSAVQFTINVSLAPSSAGIQKFPGLVFTTPGSETRSLYNIDVAGNVHFRTSADTATLGAGIYFMGIDTLPPKIKYTGESFGTGDSTQVAFEITDNVSNISYALNRNDGPSRGVVGQLRFSGQVIGTSLKHPPGVMKPLYVQMIVSDYNKTTYFPANPLANLPLAQRLAPLQSPPAWTIGKRETRPYDLVGMPLALDPPLTLEKLRELNPGAGIELALFSNADEKFHLQGGDAVLAGGEGHWLMARSPISSLRMPQAATKSSEGRSTFSVRLRKGWTQVSNPHLETLYWPLVRSLAGFTSRRVKVLWAWDMAKDDYVESDSLVPWRGYFVYNHGNDTAVTLLTAPIAGGSAKPQAKAGAAGRQEVALGWDGSVKVRLGADAPSREGIGVEDEFALPRRAGRFVYASRNGKELSSDWIKRVPGGVQSWRVDFGSAEDTLPALRIVDLSLPPGDEAWALAPSRGMKFPLTAGSAIPASGLAHDSLIVVAGPAEKIAAMGLLRGLSERPPSLDARVGLSPEGFRLGLDLPSRARVRATLWSLRGARLGSMATGLLSEGRYEFAYARDFSDRAARLAPGIYVVTVEIRGQDLSSRLSRKLILSR